MYEAEQALIRETAIGHLMDMPDKQKWYLAIFCYLMGRNINVELEITQQGEVWFSVESKDLCFGTPTGVSKLMNKHFPTIVVDLYDFLLFKTKPLVSRVPVDGCKTIMSNKSVGRSWEYADVEPVPCSAEDMMKMISTKSHGGERSDLATFYKTHKAYEFRREKEVPTDHASVKPQGIPQVFVVWFLALFPDVLKMFRRKLDIKGPHPLIITVLCERVISFKRLRKVMKQAVRSP